jgi:MFS superfamily sulfate permease-like transporter
MDLGGGAEGWHLALGVIVVAGTLQVVFGLLRFGALSDLFPLSVVHGMLAAIGVLIFAKQFPILLGIDPEITKNMSYVELYAHIPDFILEANGKIALIGILSVLILFGLPALGGIFARIPAPMIVLIVAIPLGIFMDLASITGDDGRTFSLMTIGNFRESLSFNPKFDAIGTFVFWKYVFVLVFVSSLESLLTVKAIDGLDPYRRKSDYNKDLIAIGIGNAVAGILGAPPMISEVARSSANVSNGARTRWANFFHGLFLFVAMLLLVAVIEMIPNAALAAMLIAVSYRLASPKEFIGTYKVGPEQLVIFLVTIIVAITEDLLAGVFAGVAVKIIFHLVNGAPLRSLFKADYALSETSEGYTVTVRGAATFSNFLGYRKLWRSLDMTRTIHFDFAEAKLVDHSFMEQLNQLEEDIHQAGGRIAWTGLEKFSPFSNHPLAARRMTKDAASRIELRLTPRQVDLRMLAEKSGLNFYPQKVRNVAKYKDFPIQKGNRILYEENILSQYADYGKLEVSDVTLSEGVRQEQNDFQVTVVHVSDLDMTIPDFALEPEGLWTKFSELSFGKDFDFKDHPGFSSRYYLRGDDEAAIRSFFDNELIHFLEAHEPLHVESHRNKLLVYKKREPLMTAEIQEMLQFIAAFVKISTRKTQYIQVPKDFVERKPVPGEVLGGWITGSKNLQ